MEITKIIKWWIIKASEVNYYESHVGESKFAHLKWTTNNRLTQRKMRLWPSFVKLGVQLIIFTLDINALSVESQGIFEFFFSLRNISQLFVNYGKQSANRSAISGTSEILFSCLTVRHDCRVNQKLNQLQQMLTQQLPNTNMDEITWEVQSAGKPPDN